MVVERRSMSFFYCRAPFQFNNYPSESRCDGARRLFMMSHVHQALMTIGFILVVDSLNWKSGKFIIIAVQTSYSLTDDSYLSLRHLSVISVTRIVLPQQILFYTRNVFIYVCLYLFVPFVILLILPILVYVCTSPNLMVAQKQQFL